MDPNVVKVFQRPVPKVLTNLCPTCGALPNKACQLTTGQARPEPHIDRRLAASRIARKSRLIPAE